MAKLLEQINQDLKQAMRVKDTAVLSTLRMLLAAVRNKEISLQKGAKVELDDNQTIEVISSEVKKRRDSVTAYLDGQRQDLADKENGEIKILEKYLPAQLSGEELEKIVREVIALGAGDFGKVMGQVMARVKGRADGVMVGRIVTKLLNKDA